MWSRSRSSSMPARASVVLSRRVHDRGSRGECTTEALASIEEERTVRGAKFNYLPWMAVFAFGAAKNTRRATRLHFCPPLLPSRKRTH